MYKDRMEGYKVTKDGRVVSYKQSKDGRELKQCLNGRGYPHVMIGGITTTVHRLVAWKYCKGYKEGLEVNHIDGDKTNNSYLNLEWVNNQDNKIHGMKYIPNKVRLLSDEDVREIRRLTKLWKDNKDRRYTSPNLANMYQVSKVTIRHIINGDRYSYVE